MPETPPAREQTCLIVFAKPPVEGEVKTRLVPAIDYSEATDLYRCFLDDSLASYRRLGCPVRLYFGDGRIPDAYLRPEGCITVHRQQGAGLGERMSNAFLESFGAGFNSAVIIGTDHPSLPDEFLRLAFDEIADPMSVVIGPSEDGGYYLLGMNHFYPQLFEGMDYSHAAVFEETVDRVNELNANLTLLPMWYDVDTPQMLRRLLRDLRGAPEIAPKTANLLEELATRHSFLLDEER